MVCHARDLSPDQKLVIESLLGRSVLEDEEISVRAIQAPVLSGLGKQELVRELKRYFAEVDSRQDPASAEEADEIFNEAMRSTRPGFRPYR
jgi:hypothetical protein